MYVKGVGEVSGEADCGCFTVSCSTTERDAATALSKNERMVSRIFTDLRSKWGLTNKEIKTTGFSVRDNYEYDGKGNAKKKGTTVCNSLEIKVNKLDLLGVMLDYFGTIDGVSMGNIIHKSSKQEEYLDEARKLACQNAIHKASILAAELGLALDDIIEVSDCEIPRSSQPTPSFAPAFAAECAGGSVPVSAGELTFSASVYVQWKTKKL